MEKTIKYIGLDVHKNSIAGSVIQSNTQLETLIYICINVIFFCNRGVENIKVFGNFLTDFKD